MLRDQFFILRGQYIPLKLYFDKIQPVQPFGLLHYLRNRQVRVRL